MAGLIAAAVGAATLIGWHLRQPILMQVLPDAVSMKPNAAAGLIAAGVAVNALTVPLLLPLARGLGALLVLLGATTVSQDLAGIDLGIDQILFKEGLATPYTVSPGRMSPVCAGSLILVGFALLLARRGWLANLLADAATAAVLVLCTLVLIGYGYGVAVLYYPFPFTAMSIHAAASLIVLATGLFAASPERGVAAAFADSSVGGQMIRRMLPGIVLVPVLLGWLRHRGEILGYFDTAVGTALFTLSSIVLLMVVTWAAAGALRRADADRQRALAQLHAQREWLSTTLASIGDAVIATDAGGAVIVMNRLAERLSGWDLNSAVGRPIWEVLRLLDESTRQPVDDPALKALRERITIHDARHVLLTRDQREIAVEDSSAPIIAGDGSVAGAVLIFRDITERRRGEQRQAMLVRELNHRVKNVLMIVQSLVQASFRQAGGKNIEAVARSLSDRLQALHRAHELLLEAQWSGASLKAMVERELAPYRRETADPVSIKGSDVLLPPQATSVLAMTLHELATNAAKYGALSHAEGRLSVEWTVRRDVLRLTWSEFCARPLPARRRSGFGMQLIDRGVRQNLGGTTRIAFREEGLQVEIELRLSGSASDDSGPLAAAAGA